MTNECAKQMPTHCQHSLLLLLLLLPLLLCTQPLLQRTNALLGSLEPWQIVLLAVGATLLAVAALQVRVLTPTHPWRVLLRRTLS